MPATYEIEFQEAERMTKLLKRYPSIAGDVLRGTMTQAVGLTTRNIQRVTPVYTTKLRRSIVGTVASSIVGQQVPSIVGTIGTDSEYAVPVELGRRPGSLPPREPLIRWAAVVLGDGDAGDAVRWSIFKRGTKPRGMFAKGWRASRSAVSRMFKGALSDIVKRLASGR